jgi:hypothetical protein
VRREAAIALEEKMTSKAILDALGRVWDSGRMPMFLDLVDEFDCAASPKPVLDALRALKDAGLVDFEEPFFADSAIKIIYSTE